MDYYQTYVSLYYLVPTLKSLKLLFKIQQIQSGIKI